jgi:hypothetical protein
VDEIFDDRRRSACRDDHVLGGTVNQQKISNPDHYNFAIKPVDAITSWKLNFNLGCVVKYVARCDHKGTPLKDLEKALDYLKYEIEIRRANGEQ